MNLPYMSHLDFGKVRVIFHINQGEWGGERGEGKRRNIDFLFGN